ncbi:hypothetical protein [Afipia sp. GAS231]|uniref:hypothetical protein n=1 Tax=Afipia sp. GAS231 TaxID=1882747 RepID=UPI001FCD446B|nr:hypothetical protein [Afipia sp. GAS231]
MTPLPPAPVAVPKYGMVFRLFITRLLAIAIVAALAVAPVAAPAAMQASTMHASMAEMSSMADVSSMAADMPCCPDEQKSKTCTDCPVIAMCVSTTAQAAPPATSALPVRHAVRTTHALRDDVFADGLDRPPPDQPPRDLA